MYTRKSKLRRLITEYLDKLLYTKDPVSKMFYTILTDGTFIKVVADKVVQGGVKVLREFIYRSLTLV